MYILRSAAVEWFSHETERASELRTGASKDRSTDRPRSCAPARRRRQETIHRARSLSLSPSLLCMKRSGGGGAHRAAPSLLSRAATFSAFAGLSVRPSVSHLARPLLAPSLFVSKLLSSVSSAHSLIHQLRQCNSAAPTSTSSAAWGGAAVVVVAFDSGPSARSTMITDHAGIAQARKGRVRV